MKRKLPDFLAQPISTTTKKTQPPPQPFLRASFSHGSLVFPVEQLPSELLVHILSFCRVRDIANYIATSKRSARLLSFSRAGLESAWSISSHLSLKQLERWAAFDDSRSIATVLPFCRSLSSFDFGEGELLREHIILLRLLPFPESLATLKFAVQRASCGDNVSALSELFPNVKVL
jgi:hypothetical protein